MRRAAPELVFATLLVAFGLFMAIGSLGYGLFVHGGLVGPGFVPFVAGALLAGCAAWAGTEVVLRARGRGSVTAAEPGVVDEPASQAAEPESRTSPDSVGSSLPGARSVGSGRAMLVLALVAVAAVLTYAIGYVAAFGVITFVILAVVERERIWLSVLISVAAVAVAWLLFGQLLGIPLPGGALHIPGGG
ncbi:MAG: tripartite tricarboxylate transporter TctB family protein [Streptosporangiales bacterium]